VSNAREVPPHVALREVHRATAATLAQELSPGGAPPEARAAREARRDHAPLEPRPEERHHRVVNHPVFEGSRRDEATLRVAHRERSVRAEVVARDEALPQREEP